MPQYVYGNLWNEVGVADLVLVTTNSTIKQDGALVMGAGAALEAQRRYPDFPLLLGSQIFQHEIYGVRLVLKDGTSVIGAFQVKHHWRDPARLDLIAYSVGMLAAMQDTYNCIVMNFPGIGHGGLAPGVVKPFLDTLGSHVYIYQR